MKPDKKDILSYIIQTLKNDRINVDINILNAVAEKRNGPPSKEQAYVVGQFKSINYIFTLINTSDFPVKDMSQLKNDLTSNQALFWLRELHSLMMAPVAEYGIKNTSLSLIQPHQCGTYRYEPKMLAFSPAPDPSYVPKILHHWINYAAKINDSIKDKVNNPYSIPPQQAKEAYTLLEEIPMFFSCLQPFADGNNILGKLVENIFRTKWNLPWRTIHSHVNMDYIRALNMYQEKPTGFSRWVQLVR